MEWNFFDSLMVFEISQKKHLIGLGWVKGHFLFSNKEHIWLQFLVKTVFSEVFLFFGLWSFGYVFNFESESLKQQVHNQGEVQPLNISLYQLTVFRGILWAGKQKGRRLFFVTTPLDNMYRMPWNCRI